MTFAGFTIALFVATAGGWLIGYALERSRQRKPDEHRQGGF